MRDGNEGVLCILQMSSITGTSPSDCLVSYLGHSLGKGSYSFVEKLSVYSTAPDEWASRNGFGIEKCLTRIMMS